MVITYRESISPAEFGSMSKRLCSQKNDAVSTEFGRGNSVGRNSHSFQSCKNSSGMTHSGVFSRSEIWLEESLSNMRFKRFYGGSIRTEEAVGTEITFSSSACFRRPRLLSRDLEIVAWHRAQIPASVDGGFQDGYRIRMICAPPSDIRRRCAMLGQRPPCSHRTWASYSGLSGAGSSW